MPTGSALTSSPLPMQPDCPQVLLTPWDSRLLGVPPPSHRCWLGLPSTRCGHCSPAPHRKLYLLIPKPDLLTAQHLVDKSCHRPCGLALVTSLLRSPHMKVQLPAPRERWWMCTVAQPLRDLNLELSVDPMSRVRPPYSWQDHRINDVFFSGYHIRRLPCHLVPSLGVILCVVKN